MFIAREHAEFEMGKQHLANMMGMDPENMTQGHVIQLRRYGTSTVPNTVP